MITWSFWISRAPPSAVQQVIVFCCLYTVLFSSMYSCLLLFSSMLYNLSSPTDHPAIASFFHFLQVFWPFFLPQGYKVVHHLAKHVLSTNVYSPMIFHTWFGFGRFENQKFFFSVSVLNVTQLNVIYIQSYWIEYIRHI